MSPPECFYSSLLQLVDVVDILDKNSMDETRAKEAEAVSAFATAAPE